MATQLSPEARRVLRQYLEGRLSNVDLEEWLAQAEYDSDLSQDERNSLATVRLAVIDFEEGRSEASTILDIVAIILAPTQPERPIVVLRTGASTTWQEPSRLSAMPSRTQRAGISLEKVLS